MESTTQKICVDCGKDVRAAKRVRDDSGRYFCQACYAAAAQRAEQSRLGANPNVTSSPTPVSQPVVPPVAVVQQSSQAPQSSPQLNPRSGKVGRPFVKWLAYGVFGLVAAAVSFTIYFYKVIEPQQQQMQKNLADAVAQNEKNAQTQAELQRRQDDLQERRDWAFLSYGGPLKEEFVVKVTNNYKWSKTEAIQNDPIVSSLVKELPDLEEPVRRWDTAAITHILTDGRVADISAADKNYTSVFSHAICGQKE